MKKALVLMCLLAGLAIPRANGQVIGVKSNLLHDATTTMNLGVEIGLARKWTLDIPVTYNPWQPSSGYRLCNLGVQPEVRYWFCEKFNRTFVGVHGHFADFNVGSWPDWSFVADNMKQNRYEGSAYGAGVSVGHHFILAKRWGLELTFGVGYARIDYDKFPCGECGSLIKTGSKDYFGPTKAGISLVYIIK